MKKIFGLLGITAALLISFPSPRSAAVVEQNLQTESAAKERFFPQQKNNLSRWVELCNNSIGQEALEACQKAIKINPNEPVLWANLGAEQGRRDEHEQALESLAKALELQPDYSLAYYNKCVVLSNMDKYGEAILSCTKAIEIDVKWGKANKAKAYNNLGVAWFELQNYEQALDAFENALEIDPKYEVARQNRDSLNNFMEQRDE